MLYRILFKRVIDIIVSISAIILLAPIFIIVTTLILISSINNPFFFQKRSGKNGNPFVIIKFKTMNNKIDANGNLLPDNLRITSIGKIIRKTSIDELPQLLNVLKGDMSLVGPRPLLVEYLPKYSDYHLRRHLVRPGITGWAQIKGRNSITWQEKFDYDVWYVNNLSIILDIKIIYLTILKIFKQENINASKTTTMEKFDGYR